MPRSAHRAGQAGTIAPGAFDAERLDRSVCLGPRVSIATATWTCLWVSTPTITFRASG